MALCPLALATLCAAPAAPAAGAPGGRVTAAEISFATHAGEGAEGRKRFTRDGCYQAESGGGTGGADYARDSQAGCHRPADVAAVFARLDAVAADALMREKPARAAAAGGAPARGPMDIGESTPVVLVRADGSRWTAANPRAASELRGLINDLPGENQWYAKAPEKPSGTGAQLIVLAVAASGSPGSRRTEGALTSDGRWWCYRSVIGPRGGENKLPAKAPAALPPADAAARLGRILAGVRPDAAEDDTQPAAKHPERIETNVEVAWPGRPRGPLRPKRMADTVADRFGAEMQALSPACAIAAPAAAPNAR
jgi:hypothetical protein